MFSAVTLTPRHPTDGGNAPWPGLSPQVTAQLLVIAALAAGIFIVAQASMAATMIWTAPNSGEVSMTFTAQQTHTVAQCYANGEVWYERGFVCHTDKWQRAAIENPTCDSPAK